MMIHRRARLLGLLAGVACLTSAQAEDFRLENATISSAPEISLRAKSIEVSDTPLTKAQGEEIFLKSNPLASENPFSQLTAKRVALSEVTIDTDFMGAKQSAFYKELVFNEVASGRARDAMARDIAGAGQTPSGETSRSSIESMRLEGVDVAVGLGFNFVKPADGAPYLRPMRMDGMEAQNFEAKSNLGALFHIGKMTGKDIAISSEKISLPPLQDLTQKPGAERVSPQAASAMLRYLIDLSSGTRVGAVELQDLRMTMAEAAPPVDFKIAKLGFENFTDSQVGRLYVESMILDGPDRFRLAQATMSNFNAKPFMKAVLEDAPTPAAAQFESLEIKGLEVKDFALANFRMEASRWRRLAPERLSIQMTGLAGSSQAFGYPALEALGYKSLDMNARAKASYNPETAIFDLEELSSETAGLAKFNISARFSNVSKDLFDGLPDALKSALPAVLFLQAHLDIADLGLLPKFNAADQGGNARAQIAQAAQIGVISGLGPSAKALDIAKALGSFLTSGKKFTLDAQAPNKISLVDLIDAKSSGDLLDRLTIEAKSE